MDLDNDADEQDLAETFDETNSTEDGVDIAHADMAPDVFDVTSADEDAEEDETPDEDFDPDRATDNELDELLERDDGVDDDARASADNADRVSTEDSGPAAFEAGDGTDEEQRLDEGLEETFPASDPVSTDPGAD